MKLTGNYLEVIEILLIFAASEMTIRVTFPREGKALSILPVFKELLWQLFYCIYFATKYLKNEAPFIVSALNTEMLLRPL